MFDQLVMPFESKKNVVFRIVKEFLVGHFVLKDVIDTKPTDIKKVKNLPCPKTRKNS
jgi:hypothetical protein